MSHLLPGLEKTWKSRNFASQHISLTAGLADLVTVALGYGPQDRQKHLSGWLEPSAGRRAVALPTACLLLSFSFLKGFRKLQRFHDIFSPFFKAQLKIKRVLKPSPAHEVECVGVILTNTWGCKASWGSWHPWSWHVSPGELTDVFSFSSFFLCNVVKEQTR